MPRQNNCVLAVLGIAGWCVAYFLFWPLVMGSFVSPYTPGIRWLKFLLIIAQVVWFFVLFSLITLL